MNRPPPKSVSCPTCGTTFTLSGGQQQAMIPPLYCSKECRERRESKTAWPQVGDVVDYHALLDGPITIRSAKVVHVQTLPSIGTPRRVAWIEGKAGCVAVEALTPAASE